MGLTTDPTDPNLGHGVDTEPVDQHESYLVLSDAERAKGFIRPVRRTYVHVGPRGPRYELRELTENEHERYDQYGYVRYESYPADENGLGRYWTQAQLDKAGKGCGTATTMSEAIAETYARNPGFYGATYCVRCRMHLPVGVNGEFTWSGSEERVGE